MSGFRGSIFGIKPKAPEPEHKPAPVSQSILRNVPPASLTASQLREKTIPVQIARALRDEMVERKFNQSTMADIAGLRYETIHKVLEGRRTRYDTLEKLCFKLGWQVSIHDRMGRLIVRYPPSEGS